MRPKEMRPNVRPRASAQSYEYPAHLRDAIADFPASPGVYTFHGEEGDLPLYIGKSTHLRNRVLSHLRNADEARLLRQTRRISYIRTAGEIGALLLEASMIKQQQPLMNQKLRRTRQLCALNWRDGQLEVVTSRELDFAQTPGLFGLYSSPRAAQEALRDMADRQRLCYGALGLERLAKGRACFRSMVNLCAGVCHGREPEQAHTERLMAALEGMRIRCWPFNGPVAIVERDNALEQWHVVHNWMYLGSANNLVEARKLSTTAAGFDADGYKILCRPLLAGDANVVPLT